MNWLRGASSWSKKRSCYDRPFVYQVKKKKTMFDVIIQTEQGEEVATHSFAKDSCTLGRLARNGVALQGWKIAGTHAELTCKGEGVYVTDLSGGYGTTVNGEQVTTYGPLLKGDIIGIGSYRIKVDDHRASAQREPTVAATSVEEHESSSSEVQKNWIEETLVPQKTPSFVKEDTTEGDRSHKFVWHNTIHEKLMEAMDLRRIDVEKLGQDELASIVKVMIADIIVKMGQELPPEMDRERLAREVLNEAIGLGPLEDFLADDTISEIMVNRYDDIYYEAKGKLHKSPITFSSNETVRAVIDRIVSPLGRRIDESSPMVDGRLKDGSRVNAVIPPLATKGPCLTIRKFSKKKLTGEDLIAYGSVSPAMMEFLKLAILNRKNIIVSGGTGSGKTTFLNVLSNFIPHTDRIITVEDSAELQLVQPHTVTLEGRPPNVEGKGAVSIRDLVRNCLRMRPDRIIVGECRGGESLDMLQAMNTGHDGSLTTVHANSPRDLVSRLEVMTMMAGMELPERAIREQIAAAVQLIVQQARFSDGTRKVTHIAEITGLESNVVQMQNIFTFQQTGVGEDGAIIGTYRPTGRIPEFYEELRLRGQQVDLSIFGAIA